MIQLITIAATLAAAVVAASGARASYRLLEFFAAQIRNAQTRCGYMRAMSEFLALKE